MDSEFMKNYRQCYQKYTALTMINFENYPKTKIMDEVKLLIEKHFISKELGQYFTPLDIADIMANMVKPCETDAIYDPTCGLNSLLYACLKYSNNPNLLYGTEFDITIHETGLRALQYATGLTFNNIVHDNSLYCIPNRKFNVIMCNPPYNLKGIKYENLDSKIFPIKTNNSILLYLCLCIHLLEEGGKCAFLCPIGREMTQKSYAKIRKYLMARCTILQTTELPSNTFANTKVKTGILYFVKSGHTDPNDETYSIEFN